MKKTTIIISVIVIAGILAYGVSMMFEREAGSGNTAVSNPSTDSGTDSGGDPADATELMPLPNGGEEYENGDLGISFGYPAGYAVQEMPDGAGYMIVLSDGQADQGAQIFITPFSDSPDSLTADYVRENVPDMAVDDPQALAVGSGSAAGKGVSFGSAEDGAPVLEYWFAEGGDLYQMTATASSTGLAHAIVSSFRFQ